MPNLLAVNWQYSEKLIAMSCTLSGQSLTPPQSVYIRQWIVGLALQLAMKILIQKGHCPK
jgi:hypothetical protein